MYNFNHIFTQVVSQAYLLHEHVVCVCVRYIICLFTSTKLVSPSLKLQCGHAVIGAYRQMLSSDPQV